MDNRRQTYRHPFAPDEQVKVELVTAARPAPVRCVLIDLSVEGVQVLLDAHVCPRQEEPVTVRLLDRTTPPVRLGLSAPGQVKHVTRHGRYACCGIQFLPSSSQALDDQREAALARFLTEEQRRILRKRLAGLRQEDPPG
jgi:hypothetical protein